MAVIDPASPNLLLVAEHAVSAVAIAEFVVGRHDVSHPIIRAIGRVDATYFAPSSGVQSPLDHDGFHAVPLRSDDDATANGIMLVSSPTPDLHPDVLWASRQLSRQVARLFTKRELAEMRFGQERMLLYSIITRSPTRPPHGHRRQAMIANSHAEKLFAAPEDASGGAAGCVEHAVFRRVVDERGDADGSGAPGLLLVDPLEDDLLFELLSSRRRTNVRARSSSRFSEHHRSRARPQRLRKLPDPARRASGIRDERTGSI